jgi:outer membrane protein assembly factor BamA
MKINTSQAKPIVCGLILLLPENSMTKVRHLLTAVLFLLSGLASSAQDRYSLKLRAIDRDETSLQEILQSPATFDNRLLCIEYVNGLPDRLRGRGYVTASLDTARFDSTGAYAVIFIGRPYRWAMLDVEGVEQPLLSAGGWREQQYRDKPIDFNQVSLMQQRILNYLENNGHPFARVSLENLQLKDDAISAKLRVDKGPLYRIDSIQIKGNAKVSNEYLQRYLDLRNGSTYSKEKLQRISGLLRELTYVEEEFPPRILWRSSGATIEVYLKQKRSSQASLIVGFLPNNDQLSSKKLLITGEGNLNLKNALGAGETIGLVWQQLQVKSQRLNIVYQHPYLFRSPVGLDFGFDMFRKDSSFLNVNFQIGAQYILNTQQSGKLFLQRFQTVVNGIDLNYVLQNRKLPEAADVAVTNLGLEYESNTTNYRFNPVRGNEIKIVTTIGNKKIRQNNAVLELKDPNDPDFDFKKIYDTLKSKTYQVRIRLQAAHYFPIGKKGLSTLKAGAQGGYLQSGYLFRNELFQIGGYKLLRGFDEESQYLSQFGIGTMEYRYLIGENSFFYGFVDGGWGRNHSQNVKQSYTYLGTGLGIAFETKVGIFNLAWAVGKRNDTDFNLRQSKIHFGFVSFF